MAGLHVYPIAKDGLGGGTCHVSSLSLCWFKSLGYSFLEWVLSIGYIMSKFRIYLDGKGFVSRLLKYDLL